RMNLNDDVVYRWLRLRPLNQRHPGRSRSLVRYNDSVHDDFLLGHLSRRWKLGSRDGQGLVLGIDDENREQLCGFGRACIAANAMAGTGGLVPTLAGTVDPLRLIVDL